MTIRYIGSPNYLAGRMNKKIEYIVVHWIAGKLEAADAIFQKGGWRGVSAHYGVGDTDVHQYVSEGNTAYHAGNWGVNLRSIGIEHEGGPNLPISAQTYDTSATLIAEICKRYNLTPSPQTIRPHHDFKATQCPGTLDIKLLINLVKNKLEIPPTKPAGFPLTVTVTANRLYVRAQPNTKAASVPQSTPSRLLEKGNTFTAVGVTRGEKVNNNDQWLISSRGNYVWSGGTNY